VRDDLEDDRISGAIDAANSAPVTLAPADHVRLQGAAQMAPW
jgi:hypothetical protein